MREFPTEILWAGPPMTRIAVTRSARARRLSLRVSRLDGTIKLTVPQRCSERAARAFVQERADWLAQALDGVERPIRVDIGMRLPVAGRMVEVIDGTAKSARLDGDTLLVPAQRAAAATRSFLIEAARARLADRVPHYASQLGKRAAKITLRDTRSRWGSCTTRGDLMFSWRLAMAPVEVLDYVAAHEVAHLVEMNHSPAFWAQVEAIYPGYKSLRRWLKTDGPALHRYRFERD